MADISKITPLGSSTTYNIKAISLKNTAVSTEAAAMPDASDKTQTFRISSDSSGLANDGHIIGMTWNDASKYGAQLFIDTDPTYTMALRQRNSTGTWSAWKKIPMGDGTNASGTWGISITGNAATATTATKAGYIEGTNNAANPGGALLRSGTGRADSSPAGDTWIYWDTLGGTSSYWGIRHNQAANTIGFYGGGNERVTISMGESKVTATTFAGKATSAGTADKATGDESGNNIKASYAASFSISNHTVTLKNKNGTSLGTITIPNDNIWKANSATSEGYVASAANQQWKVWGTDANKAPTWRNPYEASLVWGGPNYSGTVSPIGYLLNDKMRGNKFAALTAEAVTIEYSSDGGSTWIDYGATEVQKRSLFTEGTSLRLVPSGNVSVNSRMRVTVNTGIGNIYTELKKFLIYITSNYSSGCNVTIEAALQSAPDNYTLKICENQSITGWSGWNEIQCSFTTYGNTASSQYGRIRFTFGHTGITSGREANGLSILNIRGYGGVGWSTPSTLAAYDRPYTYNYAGAASFMNTVQATKFIGPLQGNADTATKATNDSDGNAINTTYLKRSGGQMTGNITGNSTATIGTTAQPFHQLVLGGTTTATMTAASTNPRITFQEGTGTQPVHLIYSDYDNYRSPAGLKIIGGDSATPAWLEVEGQIYGARFNGPVTGNVTGNATSANYLNLYEARSTTTTLNKTANYVAAGAMFHLVASSSTSATDNGKPPMGDANVLQMNWDNNGGYDAQLAISTGANRMEFRDQISTKKAWREVVTSTPGTAAGSQYLPVYISTTGVATAITTNSVLTDLTSTTGVSTYTASPRPGVTGTLPIAHGGTGETTALNAFNALTSRGGATDLNNALDKGIYSYSNSTTNTPVATRYGAVLNIINTGASHNNSNNWIWQYTTDTSSNNLYIRRKVNNGAWTGWTTFLNSDNYTSYTVKKDGTGASGTWGISITGNAGTATKLANARTISLTGSVTGSASFDGSGNISIATTTNHTHSDYIPKSIGTTKGDIIYWSAASTPARLGIGSNGKVLKVVSGVPAWGDVSIPYGEILPSTGTNGDVFLQTSAEYYELPAGGAAGRILMKRSAGDRDVQWTTNVYVSNDVLFGAAWNDYAEFRKDNPIEKQEPGRCVRELGDGTLALTTQRLERGCEIISDTFGFAIGQDEENGYNTPIASNGRVLAYPYESIDEFKNHIGWPVCSGPNGTVSIMTEEEEEKYPSRIVGTISEIPTYKEWGTSKVQINGRIWIRIK